MSSSTPDDSNAPGSVSPDTDASHDEEHIPLHSEADNDDKDLLPATMSLMEEHALLNAVPEVDSAPVEPEIQEERDALETGGEDKEERIEKSDTPIDEEETVKLVPVADVEVSQEEIKELTSSIDSADTGEETVKLVPVADVDASEEETVKLVPAADVAVSEEETKKLDDVQVSTDKTEEETKHLVPVEGADIESPVAESAEAESPVVKSVEVENPVAESTIVESTEAENPVVKSTIVEDVDVENPVAESTIVESTEAENPVVKSTIVEDVDVENPVAESAVAGSDEALHKQPSVPVYQLEVPQKRRFTRYWILSVALLLLLLAAILTPLIVVVSYGVNAYATYNLLRAHAYGGVQHLLTVKTIFTGASSHPTSVLDQSKLTHARQEIVAAHDDFVQVQFLIDNTPLINTVTQYLPKYRPEVASARTASQIGIDATLIGEQVMSTALKLAPNFHGPLLSSTSHTPLVTASDLQLIGSTLDAIMPSLNDIQVLSHTLSLQGLPISSSQRTALLTAFQLLPQVQTLLQRGRELLGPANWLLGVDQPRVFLVQTMDRAELRPTGGFTGQYGELAINSGRVGPFSLHDISGVEYTDNNVTIGQQAPTAYSSWWPFANWGLRDSNLSADFPTSARIAIAEYKHEVNRNVDGVISFTPFFIEHILQAIGSIYIPRYNETITAENLEQKLHYYQLDNAGIRKIEIIEHVTADNPNIRKLFTSQVASVLMGRLRHATPDELLSLGLQVLHDLKTKDLQVYMTNPQIESLLAQYNDAASIDRSNTHDGLLIVQANVSASKASQYVQTVMHDTVKLDAKGGATHTLQMQLIYNQIGPVYGLDTYRDYIRFYVPTGSHLLSGDGFDTGVALCGGPLAACAPNGVYPHQELVCPTGEYDAGASAQMIGDPYAGAWHPIDQIGPPDNTKSDESGRAMFGGYVVIPKNCSMTVTLSWYVPPLGHGNYDLLVQRQASTFPSLNLTLIPASGTCTASSNTGLQYSGIITQDTAFQLKNTVNSQANAGICSLVESTDPSIVP